MMVKNLKDDYASDSVREGFVKGNFQIMERLMGVSPSIKGKKGLTYHPIIDRLGITLLFRRYVVMMTDS